LWDESLESRNQFIGNGCRNLNTNFHSPTLPYVDALSPYTSGIVTAQVLAP